MTDRLTPIAANPTNQPTRLAPVRESANWRNLRDDRGKLMARIEAGSWVLQIRRNDQTFEFDLRDYLDYLQAIAIDID